MLGYAYRGLLPIDVRRRLTMIVNSDFDRRSLAQSEEVERDVVADSSRPNDDLVKSVPHTQEFCSRVDFFYSADAATRKHGHQK